MPIERIALINTSFAKILVQPILLTPTRSLPASAGVHPGGAVSSQRAS